MKRTVLFCAVAGCVLVADLASRPGLEAGRWAHPTSPLQAASTAQTTPPEARSPAATPSAARADSMRRRVAAGDVLIVTLPAQVSGRPVADYRMLRPPALSGLAGRSFFWRTRPQTRTGRHRLLFGVRFDTTRTAAAPADTLALIVTVTSD